MVLLMRFISAPTYSMPCASTLHSWHDGRTAPDRSLHRPIVGIAAQPHFLAGHASYAAFLRILWGHPHPRLDTPALCQVPGPLRTVAFRARVPSLRGCRVPSSLRSRTYIANVHPRRPSGTIGGTGGAAPGYCNSVSSAPGDLPVSTVSASIILSV